MTFDLANILAGVGLFIRFSGLLLTAPLFGTVVPARVRILLAVVMAVALFPVLPAGVYADIPSSLLGLLLFAAHEALIGVLIGAIMQVLSMAVQMAGNIMDLQIGLGSAQLFDPMSGVSATPLSQFKYLLGVLLLFLLNGHHVMIGGLMSSYEVAQESKLLDVTSMLELLAIMSSVALRIAAPVAAISVLIDAAAGLVNKAVPQSTPFLLALPAKLMVGLFVTAIGLPATAWILDSGLGAVGDLLKRLLGT